MVGMSLPNRPHGVGIGAIEWLAILGLRVRIAMAERLDECALYRRPVCHVFLGKHEFLPREFGRWRRHVREIDVWAPSKCDAPMPHGAGRISVRRSLERSNSSALVKPKEQLEPWYEIFLPFGPLLRDL